jgi:hypothetical protein
LHLSPEEKKQIVRELEAALDEQDWRLADLERRFRGIVASTVTEEQGKLTTEQCLAALQGAYEPLPEARRRRDSGISNEAFLEELHRGYY